MVGYDATTFRKLALSVMAFGRTIFVGMTFRTNTLRRITFRRMTLIRMFSTE
jgi:hypothetical protein